MKSLKEPKRQDISIWSIICIILISALVYLSTGGIWREPTTDVQEVTEAITSYSEGIEINLKDIDVVVHLVESDRVEVIKSTHNNEEEDIVDIQQSGSKVIIQSKPLENKGFWGLFGIDNWMGRGNRRIEVNVPKSFEGALQIRTSSGRVDIEDTLILPSVSITTASGNISLGEIQSEGQIQSTSGEISIDKLIGESHKVQTTSGDISIEEIQGECEISCVSGSFKAEKLKGYGEAKSTSGEIHIEELILMGDLDLDTVSGEVNLNFSSDSSAKITMNSNSGDLEGDIPISYTHNKEHRGTAEVGTGRAHQVNIQTVSGEICINQES